METAVFLGEIAKALAEEFDLEDEDLLLAILKRCKAASAPTADQKRLLENVEDNYIDVIRSVENYFTPNIVQALKASESPNKTLELLKEFNFKNLVELENFFFSELLNIPFISNSNIEMLIESGIRFLDTHSEEFIQRGYFFSEPEGLFFIFRALGIPIDSKPCSHPKVIKFYKKRAAQLSEDLFKAELAQSEVIKKDVQVFTSSIELEGPGKKNHSRSISEPWFADEERALRERCLLFFKRTLRMLKSFYADPNILILDRYESAVLKSFSGQELELLMGLSCRYFSWGSNSKIPTDFSYKLSFIDKSLRTFSLLEADTKVKHISTATDHVNKLYIFQPQVKPIEAIEYVSFLKPYVFNLYEASLLITDFKILEKVFLEYTKIKHLENKSRTIANKYLSRIKKYIQPINSRLRKESNRKASVEKRGERPAPGFNSDFTIFYPASKLHEPIKLSKRQAFVAGEINDKQKEKGTISKKELFNILYPEIYNSTKSGNSTNVENYNKKLQSFRLDNYCFKNSDAWRLGLIQNTNSSGMIEAQYFIDENYYKKKFQRKNRQKRKKKR